MTFSLANTLRDLSASIPDAPAVTYRGRTSTFAELHRRSSQVANALIQSGVGPSDGVAVLDKNSVDYLELLFGAGKANARFVGVNWRLAPREVEHVISDAQPRLLLVGDDFVDKVTGIDVPILRFGDEYDRWISGCPDTDPMVPSTDDDIALQLYTSGTTGLPKGATIANGNIRQSVTMARDVWGFGASSVNLVTMPMFHVGGALYVFQGLAVGAHSVVLREPDPAAILQTIEAYGVTEAHFVPTVIQTLINRPEIADTNVSSLRRIIYGASPIPESVLLDALEVFGPIFHQAYGMTETSGSITSLPPEDHDPGGPRAGLLASCGRAVPWVEISIVDTDTGTTVPAGSVGEIVVRSPQNMRGYWRNPAAMAATLTADGWLKTGDAGYLDDDGYLFLHDRIKDMIVSGGENIYPAEVESVLVRHPAVRDAAVIGVPDARWGETVKAVVVPVRPGAVGERELIDYTRELLAHYKCPTSIDFESELPRTPSGKILKKDLRAPYWEGRARAVH